MDVAQNHKNKTYGAIASKRGFQKASYIAAINMLIQQKVC
jgi:hypothetical protein